MTTENASQKLTTGEELFKMGNIGRCELVAGEAILPDFSVSIAEIFE